MNGVISTKKQWATFLCRLVSFLWLDLVWSLFMPCFSFLLHLIKYFHISFLPSFSLLVSLQVTISTIRLKPRTHNRHKPIMHLSEALEASTEDTLLPSSPFSLLSNSMPLLAWACKTLRMCLVSLDCPTTWWRAWWVTRPSNTAKTCRARSFNHTGGNKANEIKISI